ncbi:MAG: hypothetical protein WC618_01180 [Patescibacteria group bacterium]
MRIIVSQKEKKIEIIFENGKIIDKYTIAKAEEFLGCVDKFLKKYYTVKISDFRDVKLEFHNIGLLTERVVKAIMLGLKFSQN